MRPARDGALNGGKSTRAHSLTPLAIPLVLETRGVGSMLKGPARMLT
jgi:hypothetical protein